MSGKGDTGLGEGDMVHTEADIEPAIELSDSRDFVEVPKLVEGVMQGLAQSDRAAYIVYLKLCTRFGGK